MFCQFSITLTLLICVVQCLPNTYSYHALPTEETDKFQILETGDAKNTIRLKRQEDKNATAEGPSIKDLEESFGGNSHDAEVKQDAPTTPRTGFYFLLDWNSFLELDNMEDGADRRRVSLQFRPKVGDPSRFLPITVP